jgi:hypothetical protein
MLNKETAIAKTGPWRRMVFNMDIVCFLFWFAEVWIDLDAFGVYSGLLLPGGRR